MVGGKVIEVVAIRPGISRVWCMDDRGDECAVNVETADVMPVVGRGAWWQSGWVYFDAGPDHPGERQVRKVGYSYDPRRA